MAEEGNHGDSERRRASAIIADYLDALDQGKQPDRQALLQQHPEFAEELRGFFADQDQIHRLAAATADASGPPAPSAEYEFLEELGRGGMGVVYKARQLRPERLVAVKVLLSPHLASPDEMQRFQREVDIMARLEHPHIVPVYESGKIRGQPYFSMQLLEGGSLADRVPRYTGDPRAAAALVVQVARAVHHAHQRGVLHRDLKPSNILLDADGRPHVADFGLARLCGGPRLTQTGAVVGTPGYLAPEQAAGGLDVTTVADVHALGAVLYELLTGRPPYQADTVLEALRRVCSDVPARLRSLNRRLDRDLEMVCLKCLEKDPGRRYGSAEALAEDLERWLRAEPVRVRRSGPIRPLVLWARRRPAVAALLALCLLVVSTSGGVVLRQQRVENALHERLVKLLADEHRRLYSENIRAAAQELEEHPGGERNPDKVRRARELLDACPREFRALEWYCLYGLCKGPERRGWYSVPGRFATGGREPSAPFEVRGRTFVAFSPDGKRMAEVQEGEVTVRDAGTGQALLTLPGPAGREWCFHLPGQPAPFVPPDPCEGFGSVAFSPDGERLYLAGTGGARIWGIRSGKELSGLIRAPVPEACSHDGKVYYANQAIYDASNGSKLRDLDSWLFLGFSVDGKRFATCHLLGKVTIWETASCQQLVTLPGVKVDYPHSTLVSQGDAVFHEGRSAENYRSLGRCVQLVDGKSLTWCSRYFTREWSVCALTPPSE
jgi:hypothetical protein